MNIKNVIMTVSMVCTGVVQAHTQPATTPPQYERIIRAYFGGWVSKDWNQVAAQLNDGFTFTSPAPDDHISTDRFKEKCWPQAAHIQKFDFMKIMGNDHEAFAIMHVITTDGKVIRNAEYFNFTNGKIQSIEVFFGGTGQGFPTNTKP